MKESKTKQLRDFIKSHEMRYFVDFSDYSGQAHIKKAFKVEINKTEYWLHFSYGDRPELKEERYLLKTMEEAKAKAQKIREAYQKQKKEKAAARKAKYEEVTRYLNNFRMWDITEWDGNDKVVKPEGRDFVKAIKELYADIPDREKDDQLTYTQELERYIEHGTIYTQGMTFRKEHIISVKYGEDGSVEIKLIDGTTIIPVSRSVTHLIKTIFGQNRSWTYNHVKFPEGTHDEMKETR